MGSLRPAIRGVRLHRTVEWRTPILNRRRPPWFVAIERLAMEIDARQSDDLPCAGAVRRMDHHHMVAMVRLLLNKRDADRRSSMLAHDASFTPKNGHFATHQDTNENAPRQSGAFRQEQ